MKYLPGQPACAPPTLQSSTPARKKAAGKIVRIAVVISITVLTYVIFTQDIKIFLFPHAAFFSAVYGIPFTFTEGVGYVAAGGVFAITEGCMGVKLFLSLFLLLALGFAPARASVRRHALYLLQSYGAALGVAFGATLARISFSMSFLHHADAQLIHNILSLGVYFGCIAAVYLFMQRKQTTGVSAD